MSCRRSPLPSRHSSPSSWCEKQGLRESRKRRHWTLGRLERLGELVGDLGKQVGDASTRSGNLWFILATFTQRQLMALLAAMPEEDFALPECRALVQYEVDRQKPQRIYDRTKAALIELAHAIDLVGRDPRPMSGLVAWLRRQPTPRHLLRASLPATYP